MELKNRQLSRVGPQVIFGMDAEGRCTLSVGPGLAVLGLAHQELVGQNLFEVYPAETSHEAFRRVLAGEAFTVERVFQGRVLSTMWQPVLDTDGSVSGAVGVTTDITEQQQAVAEAAVARERANIMAALSNALALEVLDVETVLDRAVRSATELLADFGVIWLRSEGHRLRARAVWHADAELRGAVMSMMAGSDNLHGWLDLAAAEELTGPRRFDWAEIESLGMTTETAFGALVARFGPQNGLRLPLRSRGRLIGLIDLSRPLDRGSFTDDELVLAADLAERSALALENAQLLQEQRESREELVKFKALVDASRDLIAIADNDGRAAYLNPQLGRLPIGVTLEELWLDRVEQGAESMAEIRAALDRGERWSAEVSARYRGEMRVMSAEVFPLHHPDGETTLGSAWVGRDITALRSSEEALRAANANLMQFRALVDASPDFIAIAGLDGHVQYVNPSGRRLIDLDPDIDVSTTTIVDYLTTEGIERSLSIEQPAVVANGHWEGESTLRHRSGRAIPVAIASFLMRDLDSGEPFALATVQRDISERLANEAALRELGSQREALLERLVEAQEAERAQIAADVHDDSVQALAAVDLRLGLLGRRLKERAPDLLDSFRPLQANVMGATERLRSLLFDLETPDVADGLSDALLRAATQIFSGTKTRVAVRGEGEGDVPDPTKVVAYRIAREAMVNAYKHANATLITVTVVSVADGVEVTVADDGVGLANPTTSSPPGHYGISSMHDRAAVIGGHCEIRSSSGGGTVVRLWLPVVDSS